jgi:DNA-binding PadR family transcriptional regulator
MVRLLILWLLSERPLHGYRIKKILEDEGLAFWYPVEFASIYSALRTLAKEGWVVEEATEREGSRPPRTRYRITPAGRDHYRHLLRAAWSEAPHHRHPIDVACAAGGDLEGQEVLALLERRVTNLETRSTEIDAATRASPSRLLVDRARRLNAAETDWTRTALRQLQGDRT